MLIIDRTRAFTLIELLIVVAIIAILAALAIVNFLEAQTRAKVSRVKGELRSVTLGLESYHVDQNEYPPNDADFTILPVQLSTPVSYLTSSTLADPFTNKDYDRAHGLLVRYYTYHKIVNALEAQIDTASHHRPPNEAVDLEHYNPGALARYGKWKLLSFGPDHRYNDPSLALIDHTLQGSDIPYDPTNGTTSFGNVIRTQNMKIDEIPR